MTSRARRWAGVGVVGLCAAAVVVSADLALSTVVPPPRHPEVEDGVERLDLDDPTVLVLGSSHLRTFEAVAVELARRTGGAERMVAVPVDWGKVSSFRWTWEHRVRPLLDRTGADGRLLHAALRRVILVTQWWDFRVLGPDDDPLVNLPARAWTFGDWLADAWRNGLTPYNRSYVQHRWARLFPGSVLVQSRGRTTVVDWARGVLRPEAAARGLRERYEERLRHFRGYVERGGARLFDGDDVAAFDALLDDWKGRGLDVTVLLYPRMHGMITDAARASTLGRFSAFMEARCRAKGVRLLDLSWEHPLSDDDFGADLDHPTDAANRRFGDWVLDGPLRFLSGDRPSTMVPPR